MKTLRKSLLKNLSTLRASLNIKKLIPALVIVLVTMTNTIAPAANAAFFGWGAVNMAYLTQEMANSINSDQSDAPGLNMKSQAAVALSAPVMPKATVKPAATKPVAKTTTASVKRTMVVQVSAYSSEVAQTDDSPFITANGDHVYWGGVAANIIDANGRNLPFGTKIRVPTLYGNQIFTVNDRMNRRYTNNMDFWMADKQSALQFGRKNVTIEIL